MGKLFDEVAQAHHDEIGNQESDEDESSNEESEEDQTTKPKTRKFFVDAKGITYWGFQEEAISDKDDQASSDEESDSDNEE